MLVHLLIFYRGRFLLRLATQVQWYWGEANAWSENVVPEGRQAEHIGDGSYCALPDESMIKQSEPNQAPPLYNCR